MNYGDNVHTGLFSDRALFILKTAMRKASSKAQYRKRRILDVLGDPVREPNNEIVFKVGVNAGENEFSWSGLSKMHEAQIRTFVAKCMKDLIAWFLRHNYAFTWARDSGDKLPISNRFDPRDDIRIQEYYFVYDVMSGRDIRKKYTESLAADIRGVENDQVVTSMNECADREVERLVSEYKAVSRDIMQKCNNLHIVNRDNLKKKIESLKEKFGFRPSMKNALDKFC